MTFGRGRHVITLLGLLSNPNIEAVPRRSMYPYMPTLGWFGGQCRHILMECMGYEACHHTSWNSIVEAMDHGPSWNSIVEAMDLDPKKACFLTYLESYFKVLDQ